MKMYSELQTNELLRALRDITQWNEQLSDDWGDVSNRALDAIRNFQQKDERVHVNQPSFNSYFIKKDGLLTRVELDEYLKSTNASQSIPESCPLKGLSLKELKDFKEAVNKQFVKITKGDEVVVDFSSSVDLYNKLIRYIHDEYENDSFFIKSITRQEEPNTIYAEGTYGSIAMGIINMCISILEPQEKKSGLEWLEELIECGADLEMVKNAIPKAKQMDEDRFFSLWELKNK